MQNEFISTRVHIDIYDLASSICSQRLNCFSCPLRTTYPDGVSGDYSCLKNQYILSINKEERAYYKKRMLEHIEKAYGTTFKEE